MLGQLLLKQKNFEQALNIYSQLVADRSVSWAKLGQAICIYKLGDPEKALEILNSTLIDHPLYVQCYDWIAKILLFLGRSEEAQTALEKAIAISPKAVLRQMELGRIAYQNDDLVVAESAFKNAIRLGRYSCHKSVKNYLQFARSAQVLLKNPGDRTTQNKASEVLRAMDELKQDYPADNDSLFFASILEAKTHTNMDNIKEARRCLSDAELIYANFESPEIELQLHIVEAYIDTEQSVKAQQMIDILKTASLSKEQRKKLDDLDHALNGEALKRHSSQLNGEGVEHFEQGNLEAAIEAFDQATQYQFATPSAMLNSIQAKIAFMEKVKPNKEMLKECRALLIRLGEIDKDDERFPRYARLRKTYDRLGRAIKK